MKRFSQLSFLVVLVQRISDTQHIPDSEIEYSTVLDVLLEASLLSHRETRPAL